MALAAEQVNGYIATTAKQWKACQVNSNAPIEKNEPKFIEDKILQQQQL